MYQFKRHDWEIFALSFIALFLELAVIRWLSSEVRIFAYFKNLPLMAAFLGFGVGFFLHERAQQLLAWFPRLLLVLVFLMVSAPGLGITHVVFVDPREFFLLGVGFGDHATDSMPSLLQTAKALTVIVSIFFLVVATFACLTARLGALLDLDRDQPLIAYSVNVAGSLIGIIGFSFVSYLQLPPICWLLIGLPPLLYFYEEGRNRAVAMFAAAIILTGITSSYNPAIWSPYYRIMHFQEELPNGQEATHILVNYDGFQAIQGLDEEHLEGLDEKTRGILNRHYNIPYQFTRRPVDSVLILGGGTGNDAAAALRNGAKHVDVVEIDPVIADLGRRMHPEQPYRSDGLTLHVDDARSFLQKAPRKYDMVVFATLDSHAAFSSLSSLRMDNFVFTKESLESVEAMLNPGGGIAINFFAIKPWLTQRHYNTLAAVIDESKILAYASPTNQEVLFMGGDLFDPAKPMLATNYELVKPPFTSEPVEEVTDDWPFLFLEQRGIALTYVMPLLIILILALLPLRLANVQVRSINWHLFFMGAAFLLIETKAVTSLALIIGSTWIVNSVVIGSIMLMILVANILVMRLPKLSFSILYGLLFASILLNYVFPFSSLNALPWAAKVAAGGGITALPLLFAALIFATAFDDVEEPSTALAANLFGSLVGGMLMYLDMWTGLRGLNLVALVLYGLSAVALYRQGMMLPKSR